MKGNPGMPGHKKKESQVYRQLAGSGLTAGSLGNTNFSKNIDLVRDGMVLQESNDQNFHDLKTVNDASMRSGNDAIPGTFQFATATFVDNGTDVILTPKAGQVWRLYIPIARTEGSLSGGTISYAFNLQQTSTGEEYQFYFHQSGSTTPRLNEDTAWDGEWLEIGHGMAIEAKVSNFAGTLVEMGFLVARVK